MSGKATLHLAVSGLQVCGGAALNETPGKQLLLPRKVCCADTEQHCKGKGVKAYKD